GGISLLEGKVPGIFPGHGDRPLSPHHEHRLPHGSGRSGSGRIPGTPALALFSDKSETDKLSHIVETDIDCVGPKSPADHTALSVFSFVHIPRVAGEKLHLRG